MFLPQKQTKNTKQRKEIFRSDTYVYFDCGDGITSVCIVQTHQDIHIKCVQFSAYQLYLNKA